MQTAEKTAIVLQIAKWVLYVLAAIVFVAGLVAALSLFNAGPALESFRPLLGAFGAIGNLLITAIRQAAAMVGTIILVVSLMGTALLAACGSLLAQTGSLRQRVARLEAALAAHVGERTTEV